MSTPADCCSPCTTLPPVNVPGTEGVAGTNGTNGLNGGNAYTTTTADFVVPAIGDNVNVAVVTTDFMAIGEYLFIPGAGIFQVAAVLGTTSATLTYIDDPINTHATDNITSGAPVTPSGFNGAAGTNGSNGFTTTTQDFVVPAIGSTVLIDVGSTAFMVAGQYLAIGSSGIYQITNVNSATTVTVSYPNFVGNSNSGATVTTGAKVVVSFEGKTLPITFYAAGAVYSLTATPANLSIGATNTAVTLTSPGTWLIMARARYDYNAATFSAVRTVTTKLRRTNNTAADIANSSSDWKTQIITTLTYTAIIQELAQMIYTTTNSTDVIELWGSVSVVPSAGSLDAANGDLVAVKLY